MKPPTHTREWRANLSGDVILEQAFLDEVGRCFTLFCEKQKGYSPNNINRLGEPGVLQRVREKCDRLASLYHNRTQMSVAEMAKLSEPLEDTWQDIANYAIIALLVRAGVWPKDVVFDHEQDHAQRCAHCGSVKPERTIA